MIAIERRLPLTILWNGKRHILGGLDYVSPETMRQAANRRRERAAHDLDRAEMLEALAREVEWMRSEEEARRKAQTRARAAATLARNLAR